MRRIFHVVKWCTQRLIRSVIHSNHCHIIILRNIILFWFYVSFVFIVVMFIEANFIFSLCKNWLFVATMTNLIPSHSLLILGRSHRQPLSHTKFGHLQNQNASKINTPNFHCTRGHLSSFLSSWSWLQTSALVYSSDYSLSLSSCIVSFLHLPVFLLLLVIKNTGNVLQVLVLFVARENCTW